MATEGELWDDSALINAFDNAMVKYKKMHGKKCQDKSTAKEKVNQDKPIDTENLIWDKPTDTEKVNGDIEEDTFAVLDEKQGAVRDVDDNSNVTSNTTIKPRVTESIAPTQEKLSADSVGPQHFMDSSNEQYMQSPNGYSNSQAAEDYNQLISQYYELEEKRQRILQQLDQLGGYNYQYPVETCSSGVQWHTFSTSQDHSGAANQCRLSTIACSCCPYASCCSMTPCTSCGMCVGKTCINSSGVMDPGKCVPPGDGDIVKMAMGAAERAISSMKMETSVNSVMEEKEKGKYGEGEIAQSNSSETDLSVVLNAWYTAGFYTGKYLTEQTITKKRQG